VRDISESNTDSTATRTPVKPIFHSQHYDIVVEFLGQKILYGLMEEDDYNLIEAFTEMFEQDNPTAFYKDRFREALYEAHSRKVK